jgi:hypothetical protein
VVFGSANGCEPARAHLPEAGDDIARVLAGELHCVFAEATQAFGERGHGSGLVAVFLGRAAEEIQAEALQRLLQCWSPAKFNVRKLSMNVVRRLRVRW